LNTRQAFHFESHLPFTGCRKDSKKASASRSASIDMLVGEETLQAVLRESAAEVGEPIATLKFRNHAAGR
jgi:hypothetical protein